MRAVDIFQRVVISIVGISGAHAAEHSADPQSQEQWIDVEGCRFLNPPGASLPPPDVTVRWTGECVDGLLSGEGELIIESPESPVSMKLSGQFASGQIERGRWEYREFVYEGEFKDNKPDGEGEMIFPNDTRVKGRFSQSGVVPDATYEMVGADGNRYEGGLDRHMRMHGSGILAYADGSSYEGEFRENRIEGKGSLKRANGEIETGVFVTGLLSGQGTKRWANGSTYEGEFLVGRPHGEGMMRLPDGAQYTGGFVAGEYSGLGKFKDAEGGECEGDFVAGRIHGRGKCSFANGDRYEGEFVAGQMTGEGVFVEASGLIRKGRFVNGKQNGSCRIERPDGYLFEGHCIAGLADGFGRVEEPQHNAVYEGHFRKNLFNGEGTWTDGKATYKGTFKDGVRQGRGTLVVRENDQEMIYEGDFANNVYHGRGVLRIEIQDGESIKYEGEYANGFMQGAGVLEVFGDTLRGEFKANTFFKGTIETSEGRTYEIDVLARTFKEVMEDGTKRDLSAPPDELNVHI